MSTININIDSQVSQVITNGVTDKAPSEDAVFDALALKSPLASPTFTGTVTTPAIIVSSETASRVAIIDGSKNVKSADTATYPSLTELAYVKGATSNIQTQLSNVSSGDISFYRSTGSTINAWYSSAITAFSPGTQALSKDTIRLTPFVVPKPITLDRIAMEITGVGTAGSVVRLGIYSATNSFPTTNLLNAGTILGDSAANQSITINQVLAAGVYYLAFTHNSTANITFRSIPFTAGTIPAVLGINAGVFSGNQNCQVAMAYAYDGTFPTISSTSVSGTNVALIGVRLSA